MGGWEAGRKESRGRKGKERREGCRNINEKMDKRMEYVVSHEY